MEAAKARGNNLFKRELFEESIGEYSLAVKLDPENHLLYCNRSTAYASLKKWKESEEDARKAIELSPNFIKGHFRLSKALLEQKKYSESYERAKIGLHLANKKSENESQPFAKIISECLKFVKMDQSDESKESNLSNDQKQNIDQSNKKKQNINQSNQKDLSIKEFETLGELGRGNFSEIRLVEMKKNGRKFALKIIDKTEANRMKRRHPNINNEIFMEKRALSKLNGHPGIIELFATFQDYSCLYYLLEHCEGGELWSKLLTDRFHVGIYPTIAQFWISEILLAIEHIHSKGLVHRDIKPENVLLTANGHVKIIDFGTCKDLVETDLNGPEFVGTPQYMTPQAVDSEIQGREADLWALGCCLYQFLVGVTPFHSTSPYLCFLKIRKGIVHYPRVLTNHATDLISNLLKSDPFERLGSDAMGGFEKLKGHAYFSNVDFERIFLDLAVRIPKLSELAVRAVGRFVKGWASDAIYVPNPLPQNLNVNSLNESSKERVKHFLLRIDALSNPKVFRLFNESSIDSKCLLADPISRSVLGMGWDTNFQWTDPFFFIHISNPKIQRNSEDLVKKINFIRPSFVMISGIEAKDEKCECDSEKMRETFARISASIPILFCCGKSNVESYRKSFGSEFYSFWHGGMKGLVVDSSNLLFEKSAERSKGQADWLEQEIELGQYSAHHLIVFSNEPFYSKGQRVRFEEPRDDLIGRKAKWLQTMKNSKVKAIISSQNETDIAKVPNQLENKADFNGAEMNKMFQISNQNSEKICVVRVFQMQIKANFYGLDELPSSIDVDDPQNVQLMY